MLYLTSNFANFHKGLHKYYITKYSLDNFKTEVYIHLIYLPGVVMMIRTKNQDLQLLFSTSPTVNMELLKIHRQFCNGGYLKTSFGWLANQ